MQKGHTKTIDAIDRQILSILEDNSRETMVEIARKVGLSSTPCVERIKRLEREGYIEGYTIRLNPNLMRRGFIVFLQVLLAESTNKAFDQFAEHVKKIDEVDECHMVAGDYDCLLKIRVRDMEEFHSVLVNKISEIPDIARTNSYAVIEPIKQNSKMVVLGHD